VDSAADVVTENAGEGADMIQASVSRTLGVNLENLVLTGLMAIDGTGNALDNQLTGNGANNRLSGGAGNDTLDGGAGSDALMGGSGDDVYVVTETGDTVVEAAGEGTDTVQTSLTDYVLGANIENLTLTAGSAHATGNALDNVITSQWWSADTLAGGGGNDTYDADFDDMLQEDAGQGIDTVFSGTTYALGANVENLTLKGSFAIDGTGNALNNTMTGNSAANVLSGGAGDDAYLVGQGDMVVENAGEGIDTVYSSATHVLGANTENLVLTGASAIDGYGNGDNNMLTGNAGKNLLDGLGGADTLAGGAGDDTYNLQTLAVVIAENAGEGTDLVISTMDYTLGANLEDLQLSATALAGTGNALNNKITGTVADNVLAGDAGDDTLDGGMGADTLAGGTGNDTFQVDSWQDVVFENANEGTDTVRSQRDYTLGANLENLTLTGSAAVTGTGNAMNNVLTGSSIDNVLDGAGGADTMHGGAGNDVYFVDDLFDLVEEVAGVDDGTDTVKSAVGFTLGAELENLTLLGSAAINAAGNERANVLVGNSAANVLAGAGGDDTLDGGLGADTLQGGSGRDTFLVDNDGDVVATDGQLSDGDTVVSTISYTLGGDVENLQLVGAAVSGIGNGYTNVLIGNAGDNILDGAGGADSLIGGAGNDLYLIDNGADWVAEYGGEGFDEVRSSVSVTLAVNVEILTLTGSGALAGIGNSGANLLRGNVGDNGLDGGAGADLLLGGAGSDTLTPGAGNGAADGGSGNDTFAGGAGCELLAGGAGADTMTLGGGADVIAFNRGDGADIITAALQGSGAQKDTLSLAGVRYSELRLERQASDLVVKIAGTADSVRLQGWYASPDNQTVGKLQMMVDTTADYTEGGGDALRDAKVKTFDFAALAAAFDSQCAADPQMTQWGPSDAHLSAALIASSDAMALGGNLAWRYAHEGALDSSNYAVAVAQMQDAGFGVQAQAIDPPVPVGFMAQAMPSEEPPAFAPKEADTSSVAEVARMNSSSQSALPEVPNPSGSSSPAAERSGSGAMNEAGPALPYAEVAHTRPHGAPDQQSRTGLATGAPSRAFTRARALQDLWSAVDAWAELEQALGAPGDIAAPVSLSDRGALWSANDNLSEQSLAFQGSVMRLETVTQMRVAQL
jgi:Ca2+-binding RTX toxin-like protein